MNGSFTGHAKAAARHCFSFGRKAAGFTLMELLIVISICFALIAISSPVLASLMRETRLNSAIARMKVGLQQTRAILADYPIGDRNIGAPRIAGASYAGMAFVARWDDALKDYELLYAISNQNATNPTLVGVVGPSITPTTSTNAYGYLATAGYLGYSRFLDLEPMTLGTGLRMVGLRSNAAASHLELVPSQSFAVCMNPTGTGIPPAQQIYVNLQETPPNGGAGPWNVWDTAMYDAPGATTGAYAATYTPPTGALGTGVGEGFLTSLPTIIVYRDDDLPLSGNSPSGTPWRVANSAGTLVLNTALNPNELLAQTKGRLVLMTLQGGSPADY